VGNEGLAELGSPLRTTRNIELTIPLSEYQRFQSSPYAAYTLAGRMAMIGTGPSA